MVGSGAWLTAPAPHRFFGRSSTAEEVVDGVDLVGVRAVVTGGSSGLGAETARCLALAGAEVTLAVRSLSAGRSVAERIVAETGTRQVHVEHLDVSDLRSVVRFADAWSGPLHILVNNAGTMALPELVMSAQGFELQFATNALGACALTMRLHPRLAAAGGSRVVSVSSAAHRAAPLDLGDVNFARGGYDRWLAYGRSKSGAALLSVQAAELWADDGIRANSLHPGAIWTSLQRHTGQMRTPPDRRKTVGQGAATSVFLACAPEAASASGAYYEDCAPSPVLDAVPEYFAPGVMRWAVDPSAAEELWHFTSSLVEGS